MYFCKLFIFYVQIYVHIILVKIIEYYDIRLSWCFIIMTLAMILTLSLLDAYQYVNIAFAAEPNFSQLSL